MNMEIAEFASLNEIRRSLDSIAKGAVTASQCDAPRHLSTGAGGCDCRDFDAPIPGGAK
jgi:hypothetical protein